MSDETQLNLSFSIIVNTNGRVDSLLRTLESFEALDYPNFEVCVVVGPTRDGSHELGQRYAAAGKIKYAECDELNLSKSRNIGIRLAAGDVLAFIDDDGIPEPEWLSDLAAAYANPNIVGAGGCTYDHTGHSFQARFMLCDRFGNAELLPDDPNSVDYCYPLATKYAGLLGTNSSFLRKAVVAIGGFDEEYEYYLDETDLCLRLIDNGGLIKQVPRAFVHHKFLPSHLRNEHRALSVPFPVMKNKIYFGLTHARMHHTMTDIIRDALSFFDTRRMDIDWCVANGRLDQSALDTFDETSDRAWRVGMERGLSGVRRTRAIDFFAAPSPLLPFPINLPAGQRRNFVFLNQSFPPESMGGTSRYTQSIATAIAQKGHTVHVITEGKDFNRVDREDGVWVHRIVAAPHAVRLTDGGSKVPEHIWNHSATIFDEILRINTAVPVDAIEAASWDCEAAAAVLDGRIPVGVNLVTSLAHFLESHPELESDSTWMEAFGLPMLSLEREITSKADVLVAASSAIVHSLSKTDSIVAQDTRVRACVHGLFDMRDLPNRRPQGVAIEANFRHVLFVGRLEQRKGIDILLEAAPDFLADHPDVILWIAGDDSQVMVGGTTMREAFQSSARGVELGERIQFLGAVEEAELRWLYANCDLFVAPSRFESFGLIYVEAAMFSKPVIGCGVGGVVEVVVDGETGLLVPPGDSRALLTAINHLLSDRELSLELGQAGRQRFEAHFEASTVAVDRLRILEAMRRVPVPADQILTIGARRTVKVGENTKFPADGSFLEAGSSLEIRSDKEFVFVTFQRHGWSGFATVTSDDFSQSTLDLYAAVADFATFRIDARAHNGRFLISRAGKKHEASNGDEVIIVMITESTSENA